MGPQNIGLFPLSLFKKMSPLVLVYSQYKSIEEIANVTCHNLRKLCFVSQSCSCPSKNGSVPSSLLPMWTPYFSRDDLRAYGRHYGEGKYVT